MYFIYSTVTDSKCIYKYWELTKQRIAKQIELNASKVAGCLTFSEEEEKSYDIIIKRNETKQNKRNYWVALTIGRESRATRR